MARIIVCSLSNVTWTNERYLDSFVEGFIRSLERAGNDVVSVRTNDFGRADISFVHEEKVIADLQAFKPDLIITYNNVMPFKGFVGRFDCPVACFASDSLAFFANVQEMKSNLERYFFFNFSNDTIRAFPHWFPFVPSDRVFLFGHATDLRAINLKQDIEISFVGSIANWNRDFVDYFRMLPLSPSYIPTTDNNYETQIQEQFFEALDRFKQNPFDKFPYALPDFQPSVGSIETAAILLLTCQQRFNTLSNIADLGLQVFSNPSAYSDVLLYNLELFRCFDFSTSVTLDHATRNFNRSKVSMNLPHAHASEGFSWRVCDILASNATLLSCVQPDLKSLTRGYVDLPMYDSPSEARDLATKLLADDGWRAELSTGSQALIDEKCRFEHKLPLMEAAIPGVQLTSTGALQALPGTVRHFDEREYRRLLRYKAYELVRKLRNRRRAAKFKKTGSAQPFVNNILYRIFSALT